MAGALSETDPEFAALFRRFAAEEVPAQGGLTVRQRHLAVLAALIAGGSPEAYGEQLADCLAEGLDPVAAKEELYQATAYVGYGRVRPDLDAANAVLRAAGVALPLPPQGTADAADRREKGTAVQVAAFGPQMQDFWRTGPAETVHINRWLAANCFGDYYTRRGLDLAERELITFCLLAGLGGCEAQLAAHAGANLRVGNGRAVLIAAVSQCLPYLGYPRSLNALRCVEAAAPARRPDDRPGKMSVL